MEHQSPIDMNTRRYGKGKAVKKWNYDKSFDYKYGKLEYKDAKRAGEHGVMFAFKEAE